MLFGIIFVKRSFVIASEAFTQVDATHWVLDVSALTGGAYIDVRDVCLFVPGGGLLPLDAGLALHVQAGDSGWEYRGAVSNALPSEIFPTAWPRPEGALGYHPTAQVGVSVEPLVRACQRQSASARCEGNSAAQTLNAAPLDACACALAGGACDARGHGGGLQAGVREARGRGPLPIHGASQAAQARCVALRCAPRSLIPCRARCRSRFRAARAATRCWCPPTRWSCGALAFGAVLAPCARCIAATPLRCRLRSAALSPHAPRALARIGTTDGHNAA